MPMREVTLKDAQSRGYLSYIIDEEMLAVAMVHVKKEHRLQGIAGKLVDEVCRIADKEQKPVYLFACALEWGPETLPVGMLREFYVRRGFTQQPGRDYYKLVRSPVQSDCKR